jgi:hypothetical protein
MLEQKREDANQQGGEIVELKAGTAAKRGKSWYWIFRWFVFNRPFRHLWFFSLLVVLFTHKGITA